MKVRVVTLLEAAILSALAGGVTVAAGYALAWVGTALAAGEAGALSSDLLSVIVLTGLAGAVAMFVYAAGTLVIGIPAFLILNGAGWTTQVHAGLAGAVLSGLAALLLTQGDAAGASLIALAAIGGAVAGLVFRKVAYSRA